MGDVPTYRLRDVPAHLLTGQQLGRHGMRPADPQAPEGYLLVPLFDARAAKPVEAPTGREQDTIGPVDWARGVLNDPTAVILDAECTDYYGRVIEIALMRATGEVLVDTLVNPQGHPIEAEAIAKHGITDDMVAAAGVPVFEDIYDNLVELLEDARVICWNSSYVLKRIASEANRLESADPSKTSTPWVDADWEDAMLRHAEWVGEANSSGDYRIQPLTGSNRALDDCGSIIQQLQRMASDDRPTADAVEAPRKRRPAEVWTMQEDSELDPLVAQGMSPEDIGRLLGHTTNSVRWRIYKRGLGPSPAESRARRNPAPPKPPPAYTFDDLRKIHPNSHKRWTDEEDELLAARAADGAGVDQLIAEFGRNRNAITARLQRHAALSQPADGEIVAD